MDGDNDSELIQNHPRISFLPVEAVNRVCIERKKQGGDRKSNKMQEAKRQPVTASVRSENTPIKVPNANLNISKIHPQNLLTLSTNGIMLTNWNHSDIFDKCIKQKQRKKFISFTESFYLTRRRRGINKNDKTRGLKLTISVPDSRNWSIFLLMRVRS